MAKATQPAETSVLSQAGVPLIVTAEQHILRQQQTHFPEAGGTFSSLLAGITLATKMIQAKVRSAGLLDIIGTAGVKNVQGVVQLMLELYSNHALLHSQVRP